MFVTFPYSKPRLKHLYCVSVLDLWTLHLPQRKQMIDSIQSAFAAINTVTHNSNYDYLDQTPTQT